jgi:hypothetical protein
LVKEVKLNQFSSSLQQALVGEDLREDQLFSSGRSFIRDGFRCELDGYLQNLKVMISFPFLSIKRNISNGGSCAMGIRKKMESRLY